MVLRISTIFSCCRPMLPDKRRIYLFLYNFLLCLYVFYLQHLQWVHGFNMEVPVINLNKDLQTYIFYAASNYGVIYDWKLKKYHFLQGHKNSVAFTAKDSKGDFLVTADTGDDNMVVVWDSTFIPRRTIIDPHGGLPIAKLAFSPDAKYLMTLAYGEQPTLRWWIWSYGQATPHSEFVLEDAVNPVLGIIFNPDCSEEFCIMTKAYLLFGKTTYIPRPLIFGRIDMTKEEKYIISVKKPSMRNVGDFGKLTSHVYVSESNQILAATSKGSILVYGYNISFQKNVKPTENCEIRFIKEVKLEKTKINVISSIDNILVTGNDRGEIRFYDNQLKLLYWCADFEIGSIIGFSFEISSRNNFLNELKEDSCVCKYSEQSLITAYYKSKLPTDASIAKELFMIRDFIISSSANGVGLYNVTKTSYTRLLACSSAAITSFTIHPHKSLICLGFESGELELLNYATRKSIKRFTIEYQATIRTGSSISDIGAGGTAVPQDKDETTSRAVTCLQISPSGFHLACGLDNGELWFLEASIIDIQTPKPFKDTRYGIKQFSYSADSKFLALSDAGHTVCAYGYDCNMSRWNLIGKHRAHYSPIISVFFPGTKNANGSYRLLSYGEDRILVDYNLAESSEEYLEVMSLDRVEQTAVPTYLINWPTPSYVMKGNQNNKWPILLITTDQYKYKLMNYDTGMTLATYLAPVYGSPLNKVILIEMEGSPKNELDYLIFSNEKEFGIEKLPLDGNPYKHVGMLAHPKQIIDICTSADNNKLFLIGKKDTCMSQWNINYKSVEISTKSGGSRLKPYFALLEDGEKGWLFKEMRDLFYYIQILCQGKYSPSIRKVYNTIPIDTLPDIMRAIGFFPSEYELENLLIEAKYNVYNSEPEAFIDFESYVKLYLNHRPALGESVKDLEDSFKVFANKLVNNNQEYEIPRQKFVDILSKYGETFSADLITHLLKILASQHMNVKRKTKFRHFDPASYLPEVISFPHFMSDMLGLQTSIVTDEPDATDVSLKSSGSVALSETLH